MNRRNFLYSLLGFLSIPFFGAKRSEGLPLSTVREYKHGTPIEDLAPRSPFIAPEYPQLVGDMRPLRIPQRFAVYDETQHMSAAQIAIIEEA